MKKQLIAFLAGVTTALSASIISASALAPPMQGDYNLDWQVNISDLICLQNYLLGKTNLSNQFGITPYDLNSDKSVDIFDYIELKQMIIAPDDVVTTAFTRCADSSSKGNYLKIPDEREQVIFSASQLEEYFAPSSVTLTNGECHTYEVASAEVTEGFTRKYDSDFFKSNVLLLNHLAGVESYAIKSTTYTDDGILVIEYYDSSNPDLATNEPLPPIIAQVSVPKSMFNGVENVKWEKVYPPLEMVTEYDYIRSITTDGIKYACDETNQPKLISNTDELKEYVSGKFHTGVELSLTRKYDEKFFTDNSLILDMNYKSVADSFYTSINTEKDDSGITLVYQRSFYDDTAASMEWIINKGIELHQVTVPKSYGEIEVKREKSWQVTPVEFGDYTTIDNFYFSLPMYSEPVWLDTAEELHTYLVEYITEENIDSIEFPKIDWESKSIYLWFDPLLAGTSFEIPFMYEDDEDCLRIQRLIKSSCGDIVTQSINFIQIDKAYSHKPVAMHDINIDDFTPIMSGTEAICEGKSSFILNQYQFHDTNVIDIYQVYPLGFVRYGKYNYIGTIELEKGYEPIPNTTLNNYEDGIFELGDITFTVNDDDVTLRYKYSPDSEYTEATFEKLPIYPKED